MSTLYMIVTVNRQRENQLLKMEGNQWNKKCIQLVVYIYIFFFLSALTVIVLQCPLICIGNIFPIGILKSLKKLMFYIV